MFSFGQHSITQIETLHPDLKRICEIVIQRHDFRVQQGFRGEKEQNEAVAKGYSKTPFPLSKHNRTPSEAMDLLPFLNGKFIGWEDWSQWRYFGGLVVGVGHALYIQGVNSFPIRWGHDFNMNNALGDQRFVDAPHFEVVKP